MDNRWPNLVSLDSIPGLAPGERSRIVHACESIYRRTDFRCLYNTLSKSLHFYIREPDMGAYVPNGAVQVFDHCGVSRVFRFNAVWVDEMCRMLRQGRAPRHLKDREMAYAERSAQTDAASAANRESADKERDFNRHVQRAKNRSGMSSKFRPSAVVNGFKGA